MKKLRKFFKETKTGGPLGCLRRQQKKFLFIGMLIFAMMMCFAAASSFAIGNAKQVTCMAALPLLAGADLTQFAKNHEDLNDEEKATLGTIQKAMLNTVQAATKGMLTEEELQSRLDGITEKIKKSSEESSSGLQSKYDDALKIIETMRKDLNDLQTELKESQEKIAKGNANSIKESLSKVFESERYKSMLNGTSSKTGQFDLDLKSMRKKDVVSVTSNYDGNVYPALRTNTMTSEVPLVRPHMRDYMRVIDISEEEVANVYFRQIYDIDRAALAMSENGRLPEGSFKVKEVNADTHRIGWFMFVSKRMLRKISLIQNRILALMPSGVAQQEDFQFLYGDNKDVNFNGIVKQALTESNLSGNVYVEGTAGKVKSIASYDNGASTLVTLTGPYAKMKTGMKVVFSGFQTATSLNNANGFEIAVQNDHTIVVPCAYTAETAESVVGHVTFTISNSWAGLVPDANIGDALRTIVSYLEFDIYRPNMIIVNPMTMASFIAMKDANGRPMYTEYLQNRNGVYFLDGIIPVVPCDAIKKGKVLVGDFVNGCELYDTQRGYVEFAEDVDTKLSNEVCVLIQEEVILAVYCPEAFMYADIANVITAINVDGAPRKVAIVSPLNEAEDAILMEDKTEE